jgi:hypothetical protein
MSTAATQLPKDVVSRIQSRYSPNSKHRALFFWLWDELKAVCPETSCKTTKRYIGLYPSESSREIFAYIDPQASGLVIAIFERVFERLRSQEYKAMPFPNWNPSGTLIGLRVRERNPEIIEILSAARKDRVDGLTTVQPIRTQMEVDIDRLLPEAKQDIDSWEYEEDRFEGEKRSRYSNYYERDPKLRAQAISIHGTTCMVAACGFDFQEVYGPRGHDFIEVHHIKPLNTLNPDARQRTDPQTDMVVVCSNCHRMIHRRRDTILSIEEVSALITTTARHETPE